MKEVVIILLGLMIVGFIISIPEDESDWYLYRNEIRLYEISAEADTLKDRAMIFARSYLDAWLYRMNGSECELDPPSPPNSSFISRLNDDLDEKAFHLSGSLNYNVDEIGGHARSDPSFGGRCREGGIGVRAEGDLKINDQMAPLSAERRFESIGCQPTAYYLIRSSLRSLQIETERGIEEAFKDARGLKLAFNHVSQIMRAIADRYRDYLMERGLEISLNYSWHMEQVRERYDLLDYQVIDNSSADKGDWVIRAEVSYDIWGTAIFNISSTLEDRMTEIIYENKLYRRFSCHREWGLPTRFHYHAVYYLEDEYKSLPHWIRREIDLEEDT